MDLDADRYRLTEAEHQAIFDKRIKPQLSADAVPQARPVGVIFGGQPGAGKSAAVDDALSDLQGRGGAAQIIGDDMRGYHPRYAGLMQDDDRTAAFYTDRDTGRWVEKAIQHAKEKRLNIVIEGTMRDSDKVAETMQSLRDAGYEVDARVLAVNDRLSWQGVLQRYEAQKADRGSGRMTAPHSHQAAYDGILLTIERIERDKLADRVTVYRRGGDAIYSNELRAGDWHQPPGARAAVERERARPMTLQERQDYTEGYDNLAMMLAHPARQATIAERHDVDDLRTRAQRALVAEIFRRTDSAGAIEHHSELAGAYSVLAVIEKKADADGLSREQVRVIVDRARDNVAAGIERGDAPSVRIRGETEPDQNRGAER